MKKLDFNIFFLIKKSDYDIINLLDSQQKGELLTAIFEYQVNNKEINFTNDKIKIVFYHMKDYFDDNAEKYNEKIKNTKSKAGIISGIKRSREYKQLLTEKEQQEYLQNKLNQIFNDNQELTEINTNEQKLTDVKMCSTKINIKDDVLKCVEQELTEINTGDTVLNEKLTNIDNNINTNININIDDNTNTKIDKDIDKDKLSINHQSIYQSSSYFNRIETLDKFNQWIKWWANNDDLEFEKWKKDNSVSDELLREKIQAIRNYYSQPENHTKDFKEALKKFIINDLKEV